MAKDGATRWVNSAEFDSCLLATHLYNPWDGTSRDTMYWYNQAESQIAPYGKRMLLTEYGQSMASPNRLHGRTKLQRRQFVYGRPTKYMRENKMGGISWPGLEGLVPVVYLQTQRDHFDEIK